MSSIFEVRLKFVYAALVFVAVFSLINGHAYAAPATFTVTNTNDSGAGSLRQAIQDANSNNNPSDMDTVNFNIAGSGVHTINIDSDLPAVTEKLTIDGYTQPGAQANTAIAPNPINSTILIEVAATSATINQGVFGLQADDSILRGVAIYDGGVGILTDPKTNVTLIGTGTRLEGCYVGLRADGSTIGQFDRNQISVSAIGASTVVGGTDPSARNILAGASSSNQSAALIAAGSSTAQIFGNFIWDSKRWCNRS